MSEKPTDQESKGEQPRDAEDKDAEKRRLEKKFGWGPGDVKVEFPKPKDEKGQEKKN